MLHLLILNLFNLSSLGRRKAVNLQERLDADGEALAERLREYTARKKRRAYLALLSEENAADYAEIAFCEGQIEFLLKKEEEARAKALAVVTTGVSGPGVRSGEDAEGSHSDEDYFSQRYAWAEAETETEEGSLDPHEEFEAEEAAWVNQPQAEDEEPAEFEFGGDSEFDLELAEAPSGREVAVTTPGASAWATPSSLISISISAEAEAEASGEPSWLQSAEAEAEEEIEEAPGAWEEALVLDDMATAGDGVKADDEYGEGDEDGERELLQASTLPALPPFEFELESEPELVTPPASLLPPTASAPATLANLAQTSAAGAGALVELDGMMAELDGMMADLEAAERFPLSPATTTSTSASALGVGRDSGRSREDTAAQAQPEELASPTPTPTPSQSQANPSKAQAAFAQLRELEELAAQLEDMPGPSFPHPHPRPLPLHSSIKSGPVASTTRPPEKVEAEAEREEDRDEEEQER